MNQNSELQLLSESFDYGDYFEQTPTGMQVRHMLVPDPATEPVMEPLLDEEGNPVIDEYGEPALRQALNEDESPKFRELPLLMGELETLCAFAARRGITL
jgi:hypothetical protein